MGVRGAVGAVKSGLALLALGLTFAVEAAAASAPSQAEALLAALERGPGPSKGSADAPVTIVEFSDFQCSYCRKFWRETLPRLDDKYLQTGKARFVYRHLAILGPPSVQAAVASECANDQGKFWPYHDRLFGTAGPLGFSADRLKRTAEELRLDTGRFTTCLDGGQHRQKVERETLVGRALGITGTPGFLIKGGLLIGAQPYEVFERIIEPILRDGEQDQPPRR